jgi:diaminopimelate epimerase
MIGMRLVGRPGFVVVRAEKIEYCSAMEIQFKKMHGTLNDFVLLHDMNNEVHLTREQIVGVCDRRGGVGADGIIVVRPSDSADFFMDYMNSDGSLAEMCGNGIRCLAKYAYDNGLTKKTVLPVETRAGVKVVEIFTAADGTVDRVRVDMGKPLFQPEVIPVLIPGTGTPFLDHPITALGRELRATILSMGNPHCVIFVDEDPDPFPAQFGPVLEIHPLFPARTNVEFVKVIDRSRLKMRVWERGSGETFSCGTGACASAVAGSLKGLTDSRAVVELRGGDLEIEWNGIDSSVFMTGTATLVYQGVITI